MLDVHYSSVPNYSFEAASLGLSPQAIRTELEIDFLASTGKVCYPEFSKTLHVTELKYDPDWPLVVGIDMPGTPAAVITQVDMWGRWAVLSNLCPPEDEVVGVWEFGDSLAAHLLQEYAEPYGKTLETLSVRFYGDPAGNAPIPKPGQSPKEARSCFDILRRGVIINKGVDDHGREVIEEKRGWGWHVSAGEMSISKRMEVVRARLTTLLRDGVPAFAVAPRCRTLIEALGGAYCFRQRADGRYDDLPDKGFHSHVADALAYCGTRLFAMHLKNDKDKRPRREQRSRSASRMLRGG